MPSKGKVKGDKYENDIAKYLNCSVFGDNVCQRAPLSGGGMVGLQAGGADILGTPSIFIEAKRTERLNVREALRQAEGNIEKTRSPEAPVVVTRRNREPLDDSLVVMRLKDWKEFYKAFLQREGHLRDDQ